MLAREDQNARAFAVQLILKLREYSIYEDSSVRVRIIPVIDTDADDLQDLIDWSEDVHEHPLTCSSMSRTEILRLSDTKMTVPYLCVHDKVLNDVSKAKIQI